MKKSKLTPRKKFYLKLRNRFSNFISSIRSKNTFRTNINLFNFKKLFFEHYSFDLKKYLFDLNTVLAKSKEIIYFILFP